MNKKLFSKYQEIVPNLFNGKHEDAKRIFITFKRLLGLLKLNHMNTSSTLLDLGSGDGSLVRVCKENGFKAFGLDGSKDGINFENDKLEFDNETFDIITLVSVIEHINNPSNILREIHRVLKKRGILIVATPNFKYAFRNFYDDPTHVRPYTDKSIGSLMKLYEFKTIKVVPLLVNKSLLFWKIPFSFYISSILPFTNHQFVNFSFMNFLKGKSTAMISIAEKN
tara:strand:- start:570 stop:1241 length:672 start_codon:yes stop_codon:yes gene_type:complete